MRVRYWDAELSIYEKFLLLMVLIDIKALVLFHEINIVFLGYAVAPRLRSSVIRQNFCRDGGRDIECLARPARGTGR